MENNHLPLRVARQSEICPSIIFGEIEYAYNMATNREHKLILWRFYLISYYFDTEGSRLRK
eukprot:1987885-Pleurochrysis_carterae.AAC.1